MGSPWKPSSCPQRPSPRIYVYKLPHHVAPPPLNWRLVNHLYFWMLASPFHEERGECADFFLVPPHPDNEISRRKDFGDLRMARMFSHIRAQWPFWNRTVEHGLARHM